MPVVEKLASGIGYGKYKQVRQAAEKCLPALRIVAPMHREQVTLLRASISNGSSPADLVRTVQANSGEGHNELLRAVSSEVAQS